MDGCTDSNPPPKRSLGVSSVPPDFKSWWFATGESVFASHPQTVTMPPSVFSFWEDSGWAVLGTKFDPNLQVVTTPNLGPPTLVNSPGPSRTGGGAPPVTDSTSFSPPGEPNSSSNSLPATQTSSLPSSGHIPASSSGGASTSFNSNTPTAPQSADTATARKHPNATGAIAGGVVGAILAVVLALLLWWSRTRRRRNMRLAHHSDVENSPVDATAAPTSTTNLIPQPFLAVLASVAPFDISAEQFMDTPESAPIGTGTAPDGPSHSRGDTDRNAIAREKDPVVLPWELPASLPLPALAQGPAVAETHEYATPQTAAPAPALQPPTQTQTQRERDLEEEVQRLREQLADGSPPAYSAKPDAILPE
ncbi:hypothetical protein B0H14DRAFT_2566830 [Mycena olivaceomarginata]|nr:hypothetical protein B0H14DRAFT_2566830 [Mycena olivaceomarginata]